MATKSIGGSLLILFCFSLFRADAWTMEEGGETTFAELRPYRHAFSVGSPVRLVAAARHSETSTLTFYFFASTTADPADTGTLRYRVPVSGCNAAAGCFLEASLEGFAVPTRRYYYLEVDDGNRVVRSTKVQVDQDYLPPQGYSSGGAGCSGPTGDFNAELISQGAVVGGDSLPLSILLTGSLLHEVLARGEIGWVIADDGGLGPGLSIDNADALLALLRTPVVSEPTDVVVSFRSPHPCGDIPEGLTINILIQILPMGPAQADIELRRAGVPEVVSARNAFDVEFTLANNGPAASTLNFALSLPLFGLRAMGFEPEECVPAFPHNPFIGPFPPPSASPPVACSWDEVLPGQTVRAVITLVADDSGPLDLIGLAYAPAYRLPTDPDPLNNGMSFRIDVVPNKTYFAQLADGDDMIRSEILLANPTEQPALTRVILRDPDGEPLSLELNGSPSDGALELTVPGFGLRIVETNGSGPLRSGTATVISDAPLQGSIFYRGDVGLAGLSAAKALQGRLFAAVAMDEQSGTRTGFSIMNLEDAPIILQFILHESEGLSVAFAYEEVPALGKVALFVDELHWNPEVPVLDFRGLLEVQGQVDSEDETRPARMSAAVLLVGPDGMTGIAVSPGPPID